MLRTYSIAGVDAQDIYHCRYRCSGHISLLVVLVLRTHIIAGSDDVLDMYHSFASMDDVQHRLLVLIMFRTCIIAGVNDAQDTWRHCGGSGRWMCQREDHATTWTFSPPTLSSFSHCMRLVSGPILTLF